MSEHDIKAGQQWANEIGTRLASTSFGVICITPENQPAPFLNFEARGGRHPSELVDEAGADLNSGLPVALGFECPLWIDLPEDAGELTSARNGEGDRAWSAGAGCGALATGLAETAWILRGLRALAPSAQAFLRWKEFVEAKSGIFLWEAFVAGKAKTDTHEGDAKKAADAFLELLPNSLGGPARSRGGVAHRRGAGQNRLDDGSVGAPPTLLGGSSEVGRRLRSRRSGSPPRKNYWRERTASSARNAPEVLPVRWSRMLSISFSRIGPGASPWSWRA